MTLRYQLIVSQSKVLILELSFVVATLFYHYFLKDYKEDSLKFELFRLRHSLVYI